MPKKFNFFMKTVLDEETNIEKVELVEYEGGQESTHNYPGKIFSRKEIKQQNFSGTIEILNYYTLGKTQYILVKVTGHPEFPEFQAQIGASALVDMVKDVNFSAGKYTGPIMFAKRGQKAFVVKGANEEGSES